MFYMNLYNYVYITELVAIASSLLLFLNFQADTVRVIYGWNDADPDNDNPNGPIYHGISNRGTQNLNLLGGDPNPPDIDPASLMSFDIAVDNVSKIYSCTGNIIACINCYAVVMVLLNV